MRKLVLVALAFSVEACAARSFSSVNTDFSQPTSPELVRSFALRERYHSPAHVGDTAIYVDSVVLHHTRSEASTIVWRDHSGKWQRSQIIEDGPGGLLPVERRMLSNKTAEVPDADAQTLDRLIDDPELYDGKVQTSGEIGVGAPLHVMAIVTPRGRTTLK